VLTTRVQDLVAMPHSPRQTMITKGGVVHFVFDDPAHNPFQPAGLN
jgi:hypothetical protein